MDSMVACRGGAAMVVNGCEYDSVNVNDQGGRVVASMSAMGQQRVDEIRRSRSAPSAGPRIRSKFCLRRWKVDYILQSTSAKLRNYEAKR
jgi:hypothetical protein